MGCKYPREHPERAGPLPIRGDHLAQTPAHPRARRALTRYREPPLADEPAEARGSKGERLGPGPYHRKFLLGADREGLTIEVDADGPAAPSHNLLELGAAAAAHVHYAGHRGEIREAVVIKDVLGPEGFGRHGRGA